MSMYSFNILKSKVIVTVMSIIYTEGIRAGLCTKNITVYLNGRRVLSTPFLITGYRRSTALDIQRTYEQLRKELNQ